MWKKSVAVVLLGLAAKNVYAFEDFKINEIEIHGLKRYSSGTVYSYLPVKVGDTVDDAVSRNIVRRLYATGFFQDVSLSRKNKTLVIDLTEQPVVADIKITGNKAVKTKDLIDGLKEIGLAPGRTFSRSSLSRVEHELKRTYQSLGQYNAEIAVDHKVLDKERVRVDINITEGKISKIKAINFIGNQAFSDHKLRSQFKLSPTNMMSWFTKTDQYAKEKLTSDLEALRAFYLDHGYINYRLESSDVSIDPETQDVAINISINEGVQYSISSLSLAGEYPVPESELSQFINLKPGDIFSRAKVMTMTTDMAERLGEEGYAYASVNPVPDLNEAERTVALKLFVVPNKKVYVRRIQFAGNTKSHDEVLRREMAQMEGAILNTKRLKQSQQRLQRVGFFSEVNPSTEKVPGSDDVVDVLMRVKEAASGSLTGGIGYSDAEGILVNAVVSNKNFLGTGNALNLEFNNSKSYTTYNIGYTNPYVTMDGVSRGFNLFYNETDLGEISSVSNYTTDAFGANINYGIPISHEDKVTFGLGVQKTKLTLNRDLAPIEIVDFLAANGSSYFETTLTLGWRHNSLDRYIFPENGLNHGLNLSVTLPGSDLLYYRASYYAKWFRSLGNDYVLNLNTKLGYGDGYGDTDSLPFYQHFFAGGSRGLRGYNENTLGPRDSNDRPFGGNALITASAQLVLPNYFSPENKSVRAALFIDAGQVYDVRNKTQIIDGNVVSRNANGLRYSFGVSVTWMSPIAPLVFSLATPINRHSGEETEMFSFSFGTFFN